MRNSNPAFCFRFCFVHSFCTKHHQPAILIDSIMSTGGPSRLGMHLRCCFAPKRFKPGGITSIVIIIIIGGILRTNSSSAWRNPCCCCCCCCQSARVSRLCLLYILVLCSLCLWPVRLSSLLEPCFLSCFCAPDGMSWLANGGKNRSVGFSASKRTAAHEDDRLVGDGGDLFHVGGIFRGAIEEEVVVKRGLWRVVDDGDGFGS